MYDEDWYIGVIQEVCGEEGDIKSALCIQKDQGVLKIVPIGPSQKTLVMSLKMI